MNVDRLPMVNVGSNGIATVLGKRQSVRETGQRFSTWFKVRERTSCLLRVVVAAMRMGGGESRCPGPGLL